MDMNFLARKTLLSLSPSLAGSLKPGEAVPLMELLMILRYP